LLIASPGRDPTRWTGRGIYDVLHDACVELVREGTLDRQAYENTTMPVYFRSIEEIVEVARASDFDVDLAETTTVPTPFVVHYQQTGDLDRYVDEYVGFVQAFSEPIMRAGLEAASGPQAIAAIYLRAKELLRAAVEKYPFEYIQVAALLIRR